MNPTRSLRSLILGLGLCLARTSTVSAGDSTGQGWALNPDQAARLQQALAPMHQKFDPAENMIQRPFSSPGYHTTLQGGTVHPTRDSLYYAVALLDSGDAAWRLRAEAILRRVIGLQDQDPNSRTYGIWPWFLEESLGEMSPPDWNWADFCGTALLQVALDHRERLSPEARRLVDDAIRHAVRSIQKRNVGPGYTNIAIMGTYVTLVAAELYGWPDVREYALARLKRFYVYTLTNGGFTEYNSPTYTVVALKELGRMRQHIRHPEARRMIEPIYRMAWEEMAHHFHAPSRQWAGPHSRCYSTLLRPNVLGLIHRATEGRVSFGLAVPDWDEARVPLPCPRDLEPFFTQLKDARELVKTFVPGDPGVVGTTYLHPAFALGSINRGDTWNQRRPLLAYWGTPQNPSYFRVRLLRDGYDFAAGQFCSVQHEGSLLAGISLATDGGNRHVSLDRLKDGVVRAHEFSLRLEFGGAAADQGFNSVDIVNNSILFSFDSVHLSLAIPYARIGTELVSWEPGRDEERAWLDHVLYGGPERTFQLKELQQAGIVLALRLSPKPIPRIAPAVQEMPGTLRVSWSGLEMSIPTRPAPRRELQGAFKTSRSRTPSRLEKIRVTPKSPRFETQSGRPFVPFGVNYYRPGTGWAPQVWKQFDPEATRRDFGRLQELGANCVRVFLTFGSFYQEPGVLHEEGLKKFDQFLALAEEFGLYVHPTGPDHWEGLPAWARKDRYADDSFLRALESFWQLFAARYRGRPVLFAYDLLNEPSVPWETPAMRQKWNAWLETKYGSIAALRHAWSAPAENLTFGAIPVPPPEEAPQDPVLLDYQQFRESIGEEWTRRQVEAIKSADPKALVTVGLIQWSVPALLPAVRHYSAFRPDRQAPHLDFLEIHFYPLARGAYEYRSEENHRRNLSYLESIVREVARPGKPVVLAEFGWYGGKEKPTFDQGRHPAASEEQQARWCRAVVESTAGLATGWLNWGLYDHPQARDVSQLTGLLTAEGDLKAWGRVFKQLSPGLTSQWPPRLPAPAQPALDWAAAVRSAQAGRLFTEKYYQEFRAAGDESPPRRTP